MNLRRVSVATIAPQASLIRMTAARLFIQAKEYEAAREMMARWPAIRTAEPAPSSPPSC